MIYVLCVETHLQDWDEDKDTIETFIVGLTRNKIFARSWWQEDPDHRRISAFELNQFRPENLFWDDFEEANQKEAQARQARKHSRYPSKACAQCSTRHGSGSKFCSLCGNPL